jgi:hypothetical protein
MRRTCEEHANALYYLKRGMVMEYFIQHASEKDLGIIINLYAHARKFMEANGNLNQWGKTYPDDETVRRDIARENLYTVGDSCGIHGVFYFACEADPTYEIISDGAWSSDRPYGVIHRVAGDGSGGILKAAIGYAAENIGYLRIDTHEDNSVMQKALRKLGFHECGIIFVEDGSPRIAFDRILVD